MLPDLLEISRHLGFRETRQRLNGAARENKTVVYTIEDCFKVLEQLKSRHD